MTDPDNTNPRWPWEDRAPNNQFDAYHYFFASTGVSAVDNILKAVALAGKRYHNTDQWEDVDAEERQEPRGLDSRGR